MRGCIKQRAARTAVLWSLGIAALVAGPATASAAWTAPVDISGAGQNSYAPSVAVNDNGDAVFAWRRFDGTNDRIQARTRSAAGVLGAVQTLSGSGQPAFGNQVAIDGAGNAVVTWVRSDGANDIAQGRTLSAAGVVGPVLTLSAAGQDAVGPQVASDLAGNATFTWRRFDGADNRIEAITLSAAGVLGAPLTLSTAGQDAFHPQVAMNDAGDAALTWYRSDGTKYRVQAVGLSLAGVLSGVRTLSVGGQDAFMPQVDVDPAGNGVFTWYRFDGTVFRIQARSLSAAGVMSPVRTLSDPNEFAYGPQVGVDATGDAVFTWYRRDGLNWRVQARTLTAAGVLGAALTLSVAGQDAVIPQLAVNPAGDAVFTWYRFDGANNRVEARTLSGAGALGPVTTLSAAAQNASGPQVGIDASGDAIIDWQRFDGFVNRIQFVTGP